jgi:uncharacterized membrane protein YkvA (DUF1232 family)
MNNNKLAPLSKKVGFFRALSRYYKDPSASIFGKLVVFLAAIYVVCPVDLIPDVPIVGWLDDIGVMGLATAVLWRVVGRYRNPEPAVEITEGMKERRPFSVSP